MRDDAVNAPVRGRLLGKIFTQSARKGSYDQRPSVAGAGVLDVRCKDPPWQSPLGGTGVNLALCRCASQVPSLFGSRLVEVETTDASASLPGFPPTECLNGGRPANCGGDLGKAPHHFVAGLRESYGYPERDLRMKDRPMCARRTLSV